MLWQQHWPATVDFDFLPDVRPGADERLEWRDDSGSLTVSTVQRRGGSHYRLRLDDALSVDLLDRGRLVARARTGTSRVNFEHFLADQVIPRAIDHGGKLVLHAGAVRCGKQSILLLGESGRGKSTLSASFDGAGHDLLGDDAIIIKPAQHGFLAEPVYPSLRLMPDSVAALFPGGTVSAAMADYSAKQRIDMPGQARAGLPVAAAFILAPATDGGSIETERLTIAEACMAFVENSFALNPTDLTRARARLEDCSALARYAPAYRIAYPRDFSQLPNVREAILSRLGEAAGQ